MTYKSIDEGHKSKHLKLVNDFAVLLLAQDSLEDLLWAIADNTVTHLGFETCAVYLADESRNFLVRKAFRMAGKPGRTSSKNEVVIPVGEGFIGKASENSQQEKELHEDLGGNSSRMAVPIIHEDDVVGVIKVGDRRGTFDEKDRETLTSIASMVSTKIANAITIDRLETTVEQLKQAEQIQAAHYAIANLASTADDLEKFYAALHRILGRIIYAKNFYIALFDEETQKIHFPYFVDSKDKANPNTFFTYDQIKHGLTGYLLRTKRALLGTPEVLRDLADKGEIEYLGALPVDWLGVPLFIGNKIIGAMVVQSYSVQARYDNRDKELLTFISQHICTVLERKRNEQRLIHDAMFDTLTGLPNRNLMLQRLTYAIRRVGHDRYIFAVLFLDLDGFKIINDSLGHMVGDKLLTIVSDRISQTIRPNDIIARHGGDEFTVLLDNLEGKEQAEKVVRRILASLDKPIELEGREVFTSTSIGIAMSNSHYRLPEELLRDADAAMYRAKKMGRGCFAFFDESMHQQAIGLLELESDMHRALEYDEFILHYQPIVCTDTGRLIGFESLARWSHPQKGLIMPAGFIEFAEDNGLDVAMDWLIVNQVAKQLKIWLSQFPNTSLMISVNMSTKHFSDIAFPRQVMDLLKKYDLPGEFLKFEVTERATFKNVDTVLEVLKELKNTNVQLLLDDFGTGYSSLAYLHRLPMDTIKIDRSFISNIQNEGMAIIQTIRTLAKTLGLTVVAEGIETHDQYETVKQLGCEYGQGYYISHPLTLEQATELIAEDIPLV